MWAEIRRQSYLSLVAFLSVACAAWADVPRLIHYQGKLVTSAGAIVPGPVNLRARLYDTPSAPTPILFDETHAAVQLNRGLFSVLLGSQTGGGVPDSVLSQPSVYLGVSVDGAAELSPRIRIGTAPYASRTRAAEGLVRPNSAQAAVTVDSDGDVAIGAAPPNASAALDVSSSVGGFLPPRLTTAQRDAISNPAFGLQIFNADTNCINMWIPNTWKQACFDCTFPPPVAGNNGPICEGSTLSLNATPILGVTYQWTGPNGFSSASQNPSIPNATPAASGPYSVTATKDGCTTNGATTLATVNPIPPSPLASSNSPLCVGQTLMLTATPIAGAIYSWSGPDNFVSNAINPSIAGVTAVNAGTYSVTATVNGCISLAGTTAVTVNDLPLSTFTHVPATPVTTESVTFYPTVPGGQSWLWTFPNGDPPTSTAENPAVAWSAEGTYDVSLSLTDANGCTSEVTTIPVQVYFSPGTLAHYAATETVNGDHDPSINGVTIPVEFARVSGDTTISANADLGSGSPDDRMVIVRYEGDLTLNTGVTLTTGQRELGLCLYVRGDATVNGALTMTARGAANVAGQNVLIATGYSIPAGGGSGGASVQSPANGATPGNPGANGSNGGTGGGGAGGAWNNAGGATNSGSGAAGTSWSGGAGGGGSMSGGVTAQSGAANGGKGGDAAGGHSNDGHFVGSGAGNPAGQAKTSQNNNTNTGRGTDGTGGLLILIVEGNLTIAGTGSIRANGSPGGSDANMYGAGGGSGGGSVNLFYHGSLSQSGIVEARGGAGGVAGSTTTGDGGAGGDGTVRIVQY